MQVTVDKDDDSPSRAWSPHTAALHRRRKFDEQTDKSKLNSVLGSLNLDDDDDYLKSPIKPKSDSKVGLAGKSNRSKSPGKNRDRMSSRTSRSKSPGGLKDRSRSSSAGKNQSIVKSGSRSKLSTEKKPRATEILTQEDIPLVTLDKLAMLTDPGVPLKDRVQVEVDMMRDPDEKRVLVEFRHSFDRKAFLSQRAELEQKEQARLESSIKVEYDKEAEFRRELEKKRQQKIEEEIAKAEREAKMLEEARKHAMSTIAQGMEEVRMEAERTVQIASENRLKKKMEQEDLERQLDDFRKNEGRNMHEAQRALKEAMIVQKFLDKGY